ncbi:inverse autotransporter beta domain-containing protein [Thalassospira sp. A3_1]|uniref:inverse autotransporter beta domain-containing protein n=1 Tax=Thalassospira sp. A3_1 TaxID=2821088 RepID=UPI001ADACE46|nr:inverse autotransporter beta domain-containing protein [Thalassospira sp. A3_1]MBO9509309.1 inverse autotransporter beta domain-containing protein [Thalassospira sp. A3_1]
MKIAYIRPRFSAWLVLMALACPMEEAKAEEGDTPKWGPHLDLEDKAGTNRNLGEVDLFMPLLQNEDTLFFTNLRTRMDDGSSVEGNFGVGLRHMLGSGWNVGGIAYFDRRKSEWDNYYNQITLGLEALSTDWDFRTNAYVPQGSRVRNVDALNEVSLSGTTISFRGGEERSMAGFDGEIGWRLPVYEPEAPQQIRLFAGGYHFFADEVADITGPRLRAEMTFDEVPWLWDGSRFSIGSEWQHDNPRGSQGFVTARLRIPLQFFGSGRKRLTPMERRMTDPVVRDIDIVSQAGAFGPVETATETADGQTLTVINASSVADTGEFNTDLGTAGANTVIIDGTIDVTTQVNMVAGQTLVGSGNITVKSPSGREAILTVSGGKIAATNTGSPYALLMRDNTKLIGMTVSNSDNGGTGIFAVRADHTTGVTIENSTLTAFGATGGGVGIDARSSTNLVVRNNAISPSSNTAGAVGIIISSSNNPTIANNTFSFSTGTLKTVISSSGAGTTSFNAASTGNTTNDGSCGLSGATIGSVGFSTITCQ